MRGARKGPLYSIVLVSGALVALMLLSGPALGEDFVQDATGGFGRAPNEIALCMAEYDGRLYVGTGNFATGCEIWSYDGEAWRQEVGVGGTGPEAPGFGNANNWTAQSMAVYGEELYVGTGGVGCEVWSYDQSTGAWTQRVGQGPPGSPTAPGFGNAANLDATSMSVYGGMLYVGTNNFATGCEVWSYDGAAWTQSVGAQPTAIAGPGFGNANNASASVMALFSTDLCVGTSSLLGGCEIWAYNGVIWTPYAGPAGLIGPGFGSGANTDCLSLAVYRGELFAGTLNGAGCEVWSLGVTGWSQVVGQSPAGTPGTGPGFGSGANAGATGMVAYGNQLYAGTFNTGGGCEVWRYDGTGWAMVVGGAVGPFPAGFGDANNDTAWSAAVYNLSLYMGTNNTANGCDVWSTKTSPTWFLAEGATAGGYDTWVLVQNPNAFPVVIDMKFQTGLGLVQGPLGDVIPPESRVSYPVDAYVDTYDVSTSVTSYGGDIICERSMYWKPTPSGDWALGHDSIGVVTPAMEWYLAEGATGADARGSFETWVLVQNPNPVNVSIDMRFQTSSGQEAGPVDVIPADSRKSYRLNDYVTDFNVATQVTSLTPGGSVICERAMYWTPDGVGSQVLGHDSVGVTSTSSTWYLPEGATAGGFDTWVLVQNPNDFAVNMDMRFQTSTGEVQGPLETLMPQQRKTYLVDSYVDTYDVSTRVESFGGGIICERAMYWSRPGSTVWTMGHDSRGATQGGLTWYLPEGATAGGFETWVLVQNPNPGPVTVDLKFQTSAGQVQGPVEVLPAESRRSYRVNDYVETFDVSTRVDSTTGGFIICERAVYWTPDWADYRVLGHDSIGFDP